MAGRMLVRWNGPSGGGAPAPSGFQVNLTALQGPVFELGAGTSNPTFNASYSPAGTETFAELNDDLFPGADNVLGVANPLTRTGLYTRTGINDTITFTLSGSDGVDSDNDTAVFRYQPRLWFGVDANPSLSTAGDIQGLASSQLGPNKALNFTFGALNEYVYYGFPLAFPAAPLDFQIGAFPGGFIQVVPSVPVTNVNGVTIDYQLWRSTIALNTTISGPQTLVVSA